LLKNRIIEFFHYSITPVLQYSKELSKGKEPYEAPFQGAKAKPGPLGLDSLLDKDLLASLISSRHTRGTSNSRK